MGVSLGPFDSLTVIPVNSPLTPMTYLSLTVSELLFRGYFHFPLFIRTSHLDIMTFAAPEAFALSGEIDYNKMKISFGANQEKEGVVVV